MTLFPYFSEPVLTPEVNVILNSQLAADYRRTQPTHADPFMLISADLLVSLGRRRALPLRCHIAARSQSFRISLQVVRVVGDQILYSYVSGIF